MSWTWDNKNKDWMKKSLSGTWVYEQKGKDPMPAPKPPTDEEMIESILKCGKLQDEGFFLDMVEWLRKDAPKKLRGVLRELHGYPGVPGLDVDLSYERLCELVYDVGFRVSEVLKRRMILGDSNRFVKKYFEDFPP